MRVIRKEAICGSRVSLKGGNQTFKGMQCHELCKKIKIPVITLFERKKTEWRSNRNSQEFLLMLKILKSKNYALLTTFEQETLKERYILLSMILTN